MKIRYYGHAGQLTGYGRAAEQLCLALLRHTDVELEIRTLAPYDTLTFDGPTLPLANHVKTDAQLDPAPDVVIVHTLPGDCHKVVALAGPTITHPPGKRAVWVAYTTWETMDNAPADLVRPFEAFDEVWHPSEASACTFRPALASSRAQIRVIPHCFDEALLPFYRERVSPHRPGTSGWELGKEPFRFYTVGAWTARKNPLALIRAFAHAFVKGNNVELLMSCQGMTVAHLTHAICSTGFPPHDLPPIRSDFRPLAEHELWRLHRGADCFVSATRGEAWNLPAFEAMLAGRNIIAPRGMGHDEYLVDTTAVLYDSTPAPAMVETRQSQDAKGTVIQTVGAQGLTSKHLWREPNVLALAAAMRTAYEGRISTIEHLPGPVSAEEALERFNYRAISGLVHRTLVNTIDRIQRTP